MSAHNTSLPQGWASSIAWLKVIATVLSYRRSFSQEGHTGSIVFVILSRSPGLPSQGLHCQPAASLAWVSHCTGQSGLSHNKVQGQGLASQSSQLASLGWVIVGHWLASVWPSQGLGSQSVTACLGWANSLLIAWVTQLQAGLAHCLTRLCHSHACWPAHSSLAPACQSQSASQYTWLAHMALLPAWVTTHSCLACHRLGLAWAWPLGLGSHWAGHTHRPSQPVKQPTTIN